MNLAAVMQLRNLVFDIDPKKYDRFIITSTGELDKVSELSSTALFTVLNF